MKELSIKEKAKCYDEAIKRAIEWSEGKYGHSVDDSPKEIAEWIFPELKESEDERIIKSLIAIITDFESLYLQENYSLSKEDAIAWLEKQKGTEREIEGNSLCNGEQKPYGQREECLDCQMNYAGECKGSCAMKRDEQKLAWSEEDEKMLNDILMCGERHCYLDAGNIAWLVSIKERVQHQLHWKPSEGHLQGMRRAICKADKGSDAERDLKDLYEQLKEL